jgi:flavodoxin
MKTAIIYYSFEGNSALAAGILKELFSKRGGVEVLEIKTVDTKKRKGFSKYLWGGSQVVMHKKPPIQNLSFDPSSCDLIILGCPVWAASPAPPMASFLEKAEIRGKRVALFCCHAGGAGKALEKFRSLAAGNTIAGEIDLANPARAENLRERLSSWAESLK